MLYERIKKDLLTARKNKDTHGVSLLSTLIADIDYVMGSKGNKLTEDEASLQKVKSTISDNNIIMQHTEEHSDKHIEALAENIFLNDYLPVLMSEETMRMRVEELKPNSMPEAMKYFNAHYKGQVDNKLLKQIVIEYLK